MNQNILNIIKDYVYDTKKLLKDNLVNQYLFGSYAKNEQSKLSDIDILIIVKRCSPKIRKQLSSLSSHYSLEKGLIISPIIKDINIWGKNKKYKTLFYSEIEKYGILL